MSMTLPTKPGYPAAQDLAALLVASKLAPSLDGLFAGALPLQDFIDSAIAEWEDRTHYKPFLSDGTISTRQFTPGGPMPSARGPFPWGTIRGGEWLLDLGGGIINTAPTQSAPPGVQVIAGWLATDPGAGSVLTYGMNYILQPFNNPARGLPYWWIEWLGVPRFGNVDSIGVTAPWGYAQAVPTDAWTAILHKAAADLMPIAALRLTGGRVALTQDDVKFQWDPNLAAALVSAFEKSFPRAVTRYKIEEM